MFPLKFPGNLSQKLNERKAKGLHRTLKPNYPPIDFASNDYLGFSRQGLLEAKLKTLHSSFQGSGGSRLISGNSPQFEQQEKEIAAFHNSESALIFNSGYDANLGFFSSVPQKNDLVLYDELIHASILDGIQLGFAKAYKFRHNDLQHLTELIERHSSSFEQIYLAVESVYSMDGDMAPLKEMVEICEKYKVLPVVDEAHAIGIFGSQGRGLCNELKLEQKCFARLYTYGKAMGCHGAAVAGSAELIEYLVNFSRSFIYTTALPDHSIAAIHAAYTLLKESEQIRSIHEKIKLFKSLTADLPGFIPSSSAIHCLVTGDNAAAVALEQQLADEHLFVKAVKSPTVAAGKERIRICLHTFNSDEEIRKLSNLLHKFAGRS